MDRETPRADARQGRDDAGIPAAKPGDTIIRRAIRKIPWGWLFVPILAWAAFGAFHDAYWLYEQKVSFDNIEESWSVDERVRACFYENVGEQLCSGLSQPCFEASYPSRDQLITALQGIAEEQIWKPTSDRLAVEYAQLQTRLEDGPFSEKSQGAYWQFAQGLSREQTYARVRARAVTTSLARELRRLPLKSTRNTKGIDKRILPMLDEHSPKNVLFQGLLWGTLAVGTFALALLLMLLARRSWSQVGDLFRKIFDFLRSKISFGRPSTTVFLIASLFAGGTVGGIALANGSGDIPVEVADPPIGALPRTTPPVGPPFDPGKDAGPLTDIDVFSLQSWLLRIQVQEQRQVFTHLEMIERHLDRDHGAVKELRAGVERLQLDVGGLRKQIVDPLSGLTASVARLEEQLAQLRATVAQRDQVDEILASQARLSASVDRGLARDAQLDSRGTFESALGTARYQAIGYTIDAMDARLAELGYCDRDRRLVSRALVSMQGAAPLGRRAFAERFRQELSAAAGAPDDPRVAVLVSSQQPALLALSRLPVR